jgi:FKBP-type peptidyl-prolyl cis-trans isomerase FklB
MNCAWLKGAAVAVLVAALSGCSRGPDAEAPDREAAENLRAAEDFLAFNAKADGVRVLPSGVQYKVVREGPPGGESPDGNDMVRVDYEGTLTDGTIFDSSFQNGRPNVFTVEDLVPGWRDALQHMSVGDEWYIYVPPAMGYGERDMGDIPPNSALIFRLKLLDLARNPGGDRGAATATG